MKANDVWEVNLPECGVWSVPHFSAQEREPSERVRTTQCRLLIELTQGKKETE